MLAVVSIFLLGCPQPSNQADFADKVLEGFLSIGHSVGDATKSVVHTFREWTDRVNPPKTVVVKGERIEPFVMRMCGESTNASRLCF